MTIQFYVLLITALLQLRPKQECVEAYERMYGGQKAKTTTEAPIAGLMVDEEQLTAARGSTFLATVGQKLHRYWKISIHWLVTLRNLLAQPFDRRAVYLLGYI